MRREVESSLHSPPPPQHGQRTVDSSATLLLRSAPIIRLYWSYAFPEGLAGGSSMANLPRGLHQQQQGKARAASPLRQKRFLLLILLASVSLIGLLSTASRPLAVRICPASSHCPLFWLHKRLLSVLSNKARTREAVATRTGRALVLLQRAAGGCHAGATPPSRAPLHVDCRPLLESQKRNPAS